MSHKHAQWICNGLLVAALMLVGLLPSAPAITQAQGGGTLTYGAKVFGVISEDAPRVTYSFTGSAGDVGTVIADNWTGTLDLRGELIAPNGLVLGSSSQNTLDDNMQGAHISAALPDDGIYLLWISGEEGTAGDFALTLLGHSALDSTPLLFGQAVDVTLVPAAEPQLFSFEAEDCPTTLLVTNLSGGQPFTYPFVLKVYDQRGQTVALLRGGEELEDRITVAPRSGRYEVEISSDDPLEIGRARLLVTCSADAPGCLGGEAGTGPVACAPCPGPDDLLEGGGCPDLNFAVEQDGRDPLRVTVTWDPVGGATGYAVYVYGRLADSGEMYLTHAVWTPGDPTVFTWPLPEGYAGFRFVLRVYIGDDTVCTAETGLEFEAPPPGGDLPRCENYSVSMSVRESVWVWFEWTEYPGAEGYVVAVEDDGGVMLPGYPETLPPTQLNHGLSWPGPGSYTFVVAPWFDPEGAICHVGVPFDIEEVPQQGQFPCLIRADQTGMRVRVGPGLGYAVFALLTPGVEYPVIGHAYDSAGNLWWQIDATLFPGSEAVHSLWVASWVVTAIGDCDQVPPGEVPPGPVPPVVPEVPQQPAEPPGGVPPGSWGPCGSCDTCGYPARECVVSPDGSCVWNPATCACLTITVAVDMSGCQYTSGAAMIDTVPNCNGGYAPGTLIEAHAVAVDPKCNVDYWSGCGASGGENSISFTATSSCTLTAYMHYGR